MWSKKYRDKETRFFTDKYIVQIQKGKEISKLV